jgi:hypothetical protein
LSCIGLLVLASLSAASHPRPKGATPIRVSLVPAFDACSAPNRTHGPPLAFPSCNPPAQASSHLTVGTPDANGATAKSEGFMKMTAQFGGPGPPDDDANVLATLEIADVRCEVGTTACGNANAAGGPDYIGEVQANATIRISDHWNAVAAGGGPDAATVIDLPSPVLATCSNTADTSIGGSCMISSTAQPMFPPCCETKRMVIEFGQITVSDGGADGLVATDAQDNDPFMRQGLFIP